MSSCPCGSKADYEKCCNVYHLDRAVAETAEQLMRSRYSAFATGQIDYIIETNNPDSRGDLDKDEIESWSKDSIWNSLEIVETKDGQKNDEEGVVEFKAVYSVDGQEVIHHERSQFSKIDGKWFYTDGEVYRPEIQQVVSNKVGRNEPCPCGSEKKFKKCCGK